LNRYGARIGLTEGRIRIGRWLFARYGSGFVFIARFLPFLRNVAAVLAGTNCMAQHRFYFSSATAATLWVVIYALAPYFFGNAIASLASTFAVFLSIAAMLIICAVPALIMRREKRAMERAELGSAR
jgi:membrane protein DedA with SNARE-associated domain